MTNWTPGPWDTHIADSTLVFGADFQEVAHMSGEYEDPHQWYVMEANARLTSAAPQLLSATEGMKSHLQRMQAESVKYLTGEITKDEYVSAMLYLLDGPEQREITSAARSAVAKAKAE